MVVLLTLFDIVCCCYEGLVGVLFADLIGRVFGRLFCLMLFMCFACWLRVRCLFVAVVFGNYFGL